MKKLLYPKIYASFLGFSNKLYRFKALDSEQIIEYHHFSRCGSTPKSLKRVWWELNKKHGYRKAFVIFGIMPVGTIVKLYQREKKWYYRHLGE